MASNINYKGTLFVQSNLTPIRGEPTFETLHNIRNEIKANAKSVYSNIGGGAHGQLGLVLTEVQCALIFPTHFVYPTHLGPFIIPDGTTAHANSNIQIVHTEEVRLFHEATGVEQALVQQIVGTVEEEYLVDIRNRTTKSINVTVEGALIHLQDNYGQLMRVSRRKFTTHTNPLQLFSLQSIKSSSLLKYRGHRTRGYRRSIFPTPYSTGRASLGWKFASGFACRKYRRRGYYLSVFPDISPRASRDV